MCGCSGRASAKSALAPSRGRADGASGTRLAPAERAPTAVTMVPVRYRGARALLVRGPATGVGYACYPGDTVAAHERDVAALVASGAFVRVG